MAAVSTKPEPVVASEPATVEGRRLTIEAAKYRGEPTGGTVSLDDVHAQALANGYSDPETQVLLDKAGLTGEPAVRVPEQDDLFGDIWPGPARHDTQHDTAPSDQVVEFQEWLDSKDEPNVYSRKQARRRYARAKDVDRWFQSEYDVFSTVLLTYRAGFPDSPDAVVEHARSFYPSALTAKRLRILDSFDIEGYAGVSVLAPNRWPGPHDSHGYTHAHTALWIPDYVTRSDFAPLIEKHVEYVDGATRGNHPMEEAVKVRVHDAGGGQHRPDLETTALPNELGDNLPVLSAKYDARGTAEYVQDWLARLSGGVDGNHGTKGVSRWRPLGAFTEIAVEMYEL